MGKKINPKIFRIKSIVKWESRWMATKDFAGFLKQDILIKEFLRKKLAEAFVSKIEIERSAKNVHVIVHSARPGIIIGRGGAGIDELRKMISRKYIKDKNVNVNISIKEVSRPNLDASLIGQGIRTDIEKRMPFRRAMKQAMGKAEKAGALGVKVVLSGRLNGAEIARTEMLVAGKLPLHTLRADIDYAEITAHTTYGAIGIKVWVYKGNVFKEAVTQSPTDTESQATVKKS